MAPVNLRKTGAKGVDGDGVSKSAPATHHLSISSCTTTGDRFMAVTTSKKPAKSGTIAGDASLRQDHAMTVAEIITAAKQLDLRERMLIVSELQDTLPAEEEPLALSEEWMAEIERRIADADAHPGQSVPWETVHNNALTRITKHVGK